MIRSHWRMRSISALVLGIGVGNCARAEDRLREYLVAHPEQSHQYYLWQQCPEVGWSEAAAKAALGEPDRFSNGDDSAWVYSLDSRGAFLELTLSSGNVTNWTADLQQGSWEPSPGLEARQEDIDRVRALVRRSPTIPDSDLYLLYRRCPNVGMTREMILASLGTPSIQKDIGKTAVNWTYIIGFEGQTLELVLEADTVRSLQVP